MTVDDVVDFLKEQKLDKFVKAFETNGIDGDILEAILARNKDKSDRVDMTVMDIILEEIGVTGGVKMGKIRTRLNKFSAFVSVKSSAQSKAPGAVV